VDHDLSNGEKTRPKDADQKIPEIAAVHLAAA